MPGCIHVHAQTAITQLSRRSTNAGKRRRQPLLGGTRDRRQDRLVMPTKPPCGRQARSTASGPPSAGIATDITRLASDSLPEKRYRVPVGGFTRPTVLLAQWPPIPTRRLTTRSSHARLLDHHRAAGPA
jgi:hypothetical protein